VWRFQRGAAQLDETVILSLRIGHTEIGLHPRFLRRTGH
jgi:hypothetical protein